MNKAIGMIETIGVAVSIEVADAMTKAANVRIVNHETIDAALVTISVEGDVSSIQTAMEAGKEVAQRTGVLFAFYIIPNPEHSTTKLLKTKVKMKSFQKIF